MRKGKFYPTFMFYIILVYLEIIYKLTVFGLNGFNYQMIIMCIYLIPVSLILSTISRLFNPKINKITIITLLSFISIWFSIEFVFKKVFNTFFCLSLFSLSDQAAAFAKDTVKFIFLNIYGIILIFIPLILVIILIKKEKVIINKQSISHLLLMMGIIIVSFITYKLSLNIYKSKTNSAYELVYKINNNAINLEKLGVSLSTALDIKRTTFGFNEKIDVISNNDPDNNSQIVNPSYGYNKVNIDFNNLISNTSNSTIKSMHEYFNNDTGTQQNEYTGYYKNKNVIVFMAESFNEIGVRQDLTPTLYKLVNSSFVFDNYYSPLNLSTIGGEFQELTGLFASYDTLSKWRSGNNYFPYGLGTIFKNANYDTYAFHANYGTFQDRNKYLKALGIDNFLYNGNGIEKLMNCREWPESDYDLINVTIDNIINKYQQNKTNFMSYYITVSGHMGYTYASNAMSRKNWDKVKDLNYTEKAKAYLATQIELDKALELLIQKLTTAGILDDTVIALVGDHYPYDLDLATINEIASYEKDGIIEINRSNMIIWNNQTPTKHISKVTSQLDFMPTVYNLFGLTYDSRLMMGKDALSNAMGIVYFSNRSWVTDKGKYFASSGNFVANNNQTVDADYINNIKSIVSNRINMSKYILKNNYYKIVLGG